MDGRGGALGTIVTGGTNIAGELVSWTVYRGAGCAVVTWSRVNGVRGKLYIKKQSTTFFNYECIYIYIYIYNIHIG